MTQRRTRRLDSSAPDPTQHAETPGPGASQAALATWLADTLFSDTPTDAIAELVCPYTAWRDLDDGELLFTKGEESKSMYILVSGRLSVDAGGVQPDAAPAPEIGPRQPVGEMQVLTGGERTATVRAAAPSTVVEIPRAALATLTSRHHAALTELAAVTRARLRRNQLARILPDLFGPLDADALAQIESAAEWVSLQRGETLFRQGDEGRSVFIVVSGRLRATVVPTDGEGQVVGEIVAGQSVGEMAMFTGRPRTATVTAVRNSELVRIGDRDFERLTDEHPAVLRHLTRLTIERLDRVQSHRPVTDLATTVAVIGAGPDAPVAELCEQLTRALGGYGASIHLPARRIDAMLGTPGISALAPDAPESLRVDCLLSEHEANHRFVVLEGDAGAAAWSQRCVHEADQVVIVARAGDDPTPGEAERRLLAGADTALAASCILVLVHPDGVSQPSLTSRWLEGRNVVRHHQVRAGNEADVARLARFTAGKAIGLALGGGGARGFAHIGVLRALAEAGIPVDAVGGTSMGALIASEQALGWDTETMLRVNCELFSRWQTDVTLPIVSVLGGHRSAQRLARFIPDISVEDLWIPSFCVSTNLTRAEMVVHRRGSLRTAVRASAGVPGILPPVVSDGDLLVDGAFLRNLPADVMADLVAGGDVIAVDVSAPVDLAGNVAWNNAVSGWRIVWSRLNPFGSRIDAPNMAAILQRAGEIASRAEERRIVQGMEGLYMRVPVETFGLLDFKAASGIVEAGYRYASEQLEAWKPEHAH